MTKIVPAEASDVPTAARALADAFADDPIMAWIFGSRQSMETGFASLMRTLYSRTGWVTLTKGGQGAALWMPPNVSDKPSIIGHLRYGAAVLPVGGLRALRRGMAVYTALGRLRPTQPHLYLCAIGISTRSQGQGLGGALMRHGLQRADSMNVPTYLETSKPNNIPLYQRFGFSTVTETVPAAGAPPIWTMLRPACP